MSHQEVLLEVLKLKKHFPLKKPLFSREPQKWVKAVDDVSFEIHKGEALGLIGESGCGKSTVARLIMGLYTPTDGSIYYKGQGLDEFGIKKYRSQVSMVFQDPYSSLDSRMTVQRIIEEPLRVHTNYSAKEKREVLLPILERIGMTPEVLSKYPGEFSGGQRQRIGIARALVTNPKLIICDEPVSALDVSVQSSVLNLFKEMQKDLGLSYLFISHDISVVRHVCDRIAVMYLGHIVEIADKKELFNHTMHPYAKALMSAVPVPDPTQNKDRILLRGELPSPIDSPNGCPFRTRCPNAMPVCAERMPQLQHMGNNHMVACYLYQNGGEKE